MPSGIYQIKNTVNGKIYIGSTQNFANRKRRHFDLLRRSSHPNPKLQSAINKYGIDSFVFEIVEHCDIHSLLTSEQRYLDSLDFDENYNLALIAGSPMRGRKHSDATKTKLKAARAKMMFNGMKGKSHTVEAKLNMSINTSGEKNPMFGVQSPMAGKNHTEEVKQKISQHHSGIGNPMYGKSGSLSPTSKKVIVDGIQYDSLTLAGHAIGVGRKVVASRIKSEKYPGYSYA